MTARGRLQVLPGAGDERGDANPELYEVRKKIYPRAVTGVFARWRVSMVLLTQIIFYGAPWLPWNGRQAILFDLVQRKFYVFGLVLWPQDFIYLTGLLILAALSLFLFTAVAGRLWCGYACPQTVYTEIFLWIERKVEGDRVQRMRLDRSGWSPRKLALKGTKHGLWIAVALWTGMTFVGYFTPIRTLVGEATGAALGSWEAFWILFYAFATYGNAGWMREQVCKYMCPYARFQSVMFDSDTLIVTYDKARGEPRGARSKSVDPRTKGLGDCVSCGICVQVCPTGIDIRKGLQYECISCGSCIDACNQVMDKMGYARGLIRNSTENALAGKYSESDLFRRLRRPRILAYTGVLAAVALVWATSLWLRTPLQLNVIRDRGALERLTAGGETENVYRLQIINMAEHTRRFKLDLSGLDGAHIVGAPPVIELTALSSRVIPVDVDADVAATKTRSTPIVFRLAAEDDPRTTASAKSVFFAH